MQDSSAPEPWRSFWAKTDRSGLRPDWTRPLWAHLIDVACVAELLWDRVVPAHTRRRLAGAIHLAEEDAGRWYAMLIGMHDIGKAIPSFQSMHCPSSEKLKGVGFPFKRDGYGKTDRLHHGHASIPALIDWLTRRGATLGWASSIIEAISAGIGFHHGKLETRASWENGRLRNTDLTGVGPWAQARLDLLDAIASTWNIRWPAIIEGPPRMWPTWSLELCGWCTLADWLGSMEEMFPDVAHDDDLSRYLAESCRGAERALERAGIGSRAALRLRPFGDVFVDEEGRPREPRPLQQICADRIDVEIRSPEASLTIIEAPTGEGKTEAAFYLAQRQQGGRGGGIYVAMPSQATSNGLFGRFEMFLHRAHDPDAGPVNLLLIHGMSGLHTGQQRLVEAFINARRSMEPVYDEESGSNRDARVETATWFLPKKRSLLAPYGVGTVDQVLLGVLYAKHFFLRLFGLAGKTVIFDEVHAYDTYMNELFLRLLEWLREVGANVIVLSATLPEKTRGQILGRWSGSSIESNGSPSSYPAIWHVNREGRVDLHTFRAAQGQRAGLKVSSPDPDEVADTVAEAVRQGAAVAVIVNTVARAQRVFRAVAKRVDLTHEDLILFHARFPYERRRTIEDRVCERFGPRREPGRPAVLVATQVAEQSLDFDVDVMFSDLAPIDLLLQRAGRLHRHHDRHAGRRPSKFSDPTLTVLIDETAGSSLPNVTEVSGHGHVYQPATLYRTYRTLKRRNGWSLPDDYRALIEAVYGPEADRPPEELDNEVRSTWEKAERQLHDQWTTERQEAERRIIPPPGRIRGIVEIAEMEQLDPDDAPPETHPAYLAVTRLGGPSYPIVCLHRSSDGRLWFDIGCTEAMPSLEEIDHYINQERRDKILSISRRLIDCSLSLSGHAARAAVHHLNDHGWEKIRELLSAVRYHRAMIFEAGHWRSDDGSHHYEYNLAEGIIRHANDTED